MKKQITLIITMVMLGIFFGANAQTVDTENAKTSIDSDHKIEVLYFHTSRRCITCNAVEKISKETVEKNYGKEVVFMAYNLDEKEGKSIGKKLRVSGSTLLVISGKEKVNLTNEAFMNAKSNPEKLEATLKETIDKFL